MKTHRVIILGILTIIFLGLFLYTERVHSQDFTNQKNRFQYDYQQQQKMQQDKFGQKLKYQDQKLKASQDRIRADQLKHNQQQKQFDLERRKAREKRQLEQQERSLTPEEFMKREKQLEERFESERKLEED